MEPEIKTNAYGELYLEDGGRTIRLYRFREALTIARISATTYYTCVKRGLIRDARLRDRGCWRLFTEAEVEALVRLSNARRDGVQEWHLPPKKEQRLADGNSVDWRESP